MVAWFAATLRDTTAWQRSGPRSLRSSSSRCAAVNLHKVKPRIRDHEICVVVAFLCPKGNGVVAGDVKIQKGRWCRTAHSHVNHRLVFLIIQLYFKRIGAVICQIVGTAQGSDKTDKIISEIKGGKIL